MKRILLIFVVFCTILNTEAQVFNSDVNLQKGGWFLGAEPVYIVNSNFMFFVHGGYGIKSGINLDLNAGFGGGVDYLGGDLKWALVKHVSLNTGFFISGGTAGINGCLNLSIPIRSDIRLITGAHLNIDFPGNKIETPFWIPVGVDIGLSKNMGLILEGEIGFKADSRMGGGLAFYF